MKIFILVAILLAGAFAAPSGPSRNNKNGRITNGQDAQRNQFPHQVAFDWGLLGMWSFFCGGSIINENYVITAGHCITEAPSIGGFRIRAGLLNLNDNLPSVQTIGVSSYVVHEDYQGGVNPFDIAVLRLAAPLTFSEAVQPIALPQAGVVATGEATISGWGSTSTSNIADMPNTLQTVTVPLLTLSECGSALAALFGTSDPLDSTNVCTGPLFSAISVCGGDSGGPLIQNGELIGVVSWGVTPCGWPGAPSVYVQVSSFIDWINNNSS